MLRNYLLTALRNWGTHKLFTFINIGGLAVGLTCAVFIMLFVRDELSYDRWIPDSENLYRVETTFYLKTLGGFELPPTIVGGASYPLLDALARVPEVMGTVHLKPWDATVSTEDRQFAERISFVDPQFFDVVQLPLTEGDRLRVFAQPDSVVLSQSAARKYFGTDAGVIGKTINASPSVACSSAQATCELRTHTLVVTGVMRDLPYNSQFVLSMIVPNTSLADYTSPGAKESWGSVDGLGYVRLAPGANPASVLEALRAIAGTPPPYGQQPFWEAVVPRLTPLWDVHLFSTNVEMNWGMNELGVNDWSSSTTPVGSGMTVYAFAVVGVLILLVASFNFTNLAIARATLRVREISVRKVVGARRTQIALQFISESVLMALAALALTLAVVHLLLPTFSGFLERSLSFHYFRDGSLFALIVGVALTAGLLSGLYPAFVLSSFRPATALRGSAAQLAGSGGFRTTLVVLQFAVSIALGIAAAVVFAQISYARRVDLGFQREGIVVIDRAGTMSPLNRENFVNALRGHSGIVDAGAGTDIPIRNPGLGLQTNTQIPGRPDTALRYVNFSPQFVSTYGVRLVAGRYLSDDYGGDRRTTGNTANVMINVEAARMFGFASPEEAIGKTTLYSNRVSATIVGVIDDMKMGGPQQSAVGSIYFYVPQFQNTVSVRVRAEGLADTLAFIDKTWSRFAPGLAIRRYFLEDEFDKHFRADERQGQVFGLFVGIAIFISCLGLFGLAAFTAERRTKEIGVRKAFGAKTQQILPLLLWQFSVPVLIANVIAWPLAYFYLQAWLEGYADRISLNPLYFLGAGAAALLIAWATVYAHAYRVARANPITALRYE